MSVYFDDSSDLSITKLMEAKDFEQAFQVANSLIDDMEKLKKSGKDTVATKFYKKILDQLERMPIDTETQARQVGSLASKITDAFSLKPDPDIAARGTEMCKKSADKMLTELKKKKYPGSYLEETRNNLKPLAKCSQAVAGVNLDAFKPDVELPMYTTLFPLIEGEGHTENYPDYEDDQKSAKAKQKFERTANGLIELCYVCSKQLAITMSTQDDTEFMTAEFFNLTSTVRLGRDISRTKIESHDVTLFPSHDFIKLTSKVHIALCTSAENVFWWTRKEEIFTDIAIIQFNVNEKRVSNFHKPFTLTLRTNHDMIAFIKLHSARTPKIPDNNLPKIERDFGKMAMHRIDAYRKQSFTVEFIRLPADVILDVVVTDFYKPTFEEFRETATQVDKHRNKLFISNTKYYDSWYYLAVLPNSMIGNSTPYKFSVYTASCFRWGVRESEWIFACGSRRDSHINKIICECYHTSAIAAMVLNNEIKVEETLTEEIVLELQASYIILVSVAVAFFLYCIFLTWFSIVAADEVLQEPIYFLSDVPSISRYGYVLIVKTGNKSRAGTTSNVTIKIYGTKSESNPHVLNYPDPEKKLLQKNEENWFFLATEFYLGDLEKIELWCDFIGYSPAWFCSDVEVFDIQQNKYWLFQVNTWFEVLRNEEMTYTAFPVKSDNIKEKKTIAFNLLKKFKNSFRGAHMWDLVNREEQTITRMKRLHIIFSIFLTTYSMGLYLYGCPKLQNNDSLSYTGHYGIDKRVVLNTIGCFMLTFIIHFPVVWFLRYPRQNIFGKYQKVSTKYSLSTNTLCWFFLITNIIISMTLLITLGFWVPHITGLLWLTSIIISLLVYIFIMENIMRVIINFTTNQQTRVKTIFGQIKLSLSIVEKQRIMMYKTFGPTLLRPFFSHLYKPLDKLTLKKQRHWAEIKERLWEIVEDLIMITIYVTLLYLVILMDRDMMTYKSHLEVEELIQGTHSRTNLLDDALHRKEIGDYIRDTLIPSMQSLQWYGRYVAKNPGMTIDRANKYLGIARLRQHRTYSIPCTSDLVNQTSCNPTYLWHHQFKNFSEGWMDDELSNKFSRMDPIWDYVSERKAGTVEYVGTLAIYSGGGYVATLGRTIQNSKLNLDYILRNGWIDHLSRCIFIEFLMYNPSNNLFNSVRIKFEISAMGYTENKLEVHTARLLFVKEETGIMVWLILLSFIIMLTILIIKLSYRIIRKRKLLLKDIWHVADIFIILINLACLGLYLARSDVVKIFLSDVESAKNNEFVNYFHLMYTERSLTIVAAILVFLATLRLWKLMRFLTIVKVVEKTLILSAAPLLGLFLYQVVFTLACTFYAILRYGNYAQDFRSVSNTISILSISSLNLYEEFDFELISNSMGYFFYSSFMIVMLGIFTLYIAVITISYAEAQFFYSNEEDYNILDLLKERSQYYRELVKIKWRKFRIRGGTNKGKLDRKVLPKADEFRYANCVTLPTNKINGMAFITKCLLRNMRKQRKIRITDKDADLIKHTIVNLFRKDTEDKQIFFISNIQGEKIRFVDDEVMLKMEGVVEEFLTPDDGRLERFQRRQLCKKIVKSHEEKINDIADNLNILLDVLNVVDIEA